MTLLADLVDASTRVADRSSRTAKIEELAACLRALDPGEIEIGIALLAGQPRQGKLGAGYALLRAAASLPANETASLSLSELDRGLSEFAAIRGEGSASRRSSLLQELFARTTVTERDFLVRLLVGELRQGALEGLALEAIAAAAKLPPAVVRRAAMYADKPGELARLALTEGAAGLGRLQLQTMHPVAPMLAQTAQDVPEALGLLGRAQLEWKLDGARVQVHKSGEQVRVFTRTLKEVTPAVPEITEAMQALPAADLVLDGEAIALHASGAPYPFQVTMRRFGRKLDVAALRRSLPLSVFFFDCLKREGEVLVERSTTQRFAALQGALPEALVIPHLVTADPDQGQTFFEAAIARGHEGLMAKSPEAPYEAGNRGSAWLKIKRAHTLDLVVLAAEWGHGRRQGWLSNLHLGARDPHSGGFVMLGKTFKGLTDALLTWQTRELLARETRRDDWTVHVRPELVVEIAFNDVQTSSQYPGGVALRFARVKAYRPDKRPEEADTIDAVRAIRDAQIARAGG